MQLTLKWFRGQAESRVHAYCLLDDFVAPNENKIKLVR